MKKRSLKELQAALQGSFSIDDYLELRWRFPRQDSPLWITMASEISSPSVGLDLAFQLERDLKRFGIKILWFLGTLEGDRILTDMLCLSILRALSRRAVVLKKNPHAVASGLAIGDAMVDFLCTAVLESVAYHDLILPHSFQILLKCRLGIFENSIIRERILEQRRTAVAAYIADNPNAKDREVARHFGLSNSTVSRWKADEGFKKTIEVFRRSPFTLKP